MTYFAKHTELPQVSARGVAEGVKLPLPIVTKLLKLLTRGKLLHSTQGALGGYRLGKNTDEISVADVIEAIDGTYAMTECSLDTGLCKTENHCNVKHHWALINHAVRDALKRLPLHMMVNNPNQMRTPLPQFSNFVTEKKVSS